VTNDSSTTRKVDLAVVLELTDRVKNNLRRSGPQYLNQTYHEAVRHSPIAVSIETKVVGEGWGAGQTQLAVWAFAQFAHLREICGAAPLFLPLLIVQGDQWTFLAATEEEIDDGGDVEEEPEYKTIIWEKIPLGSTSSFDGVWKVSAVLQYLAAWAVEDHARWLREHLGLQHVWELPEPRSSAAGS